MHEYEAMAAMAQQIASLEQRLKDAERERDEAQRAKYGTPCKCSSWVEACAESEEKLEKAEQQIALLREALQEYQNPDSWEWTGDGWVWSGGNLDYRIVPYRKDRAALSRHPTPEESTPEAKESRCPGCGYTKEDAQYHGDHRLCKNAGKAPWDTPQPPQS